MIGKIANSGNVGDMVSAAVVIGAAEKSTDIRKESTQTVDAATEEYGNIGKASEVDLRKVEDNAETDTSKQDEEERENQEKKPVDEHFVSYMTKELNKLMSRMNCNLQFNYHKEVNVMSVKMIDKATGDVLKEIPSEEMIENMMEAREWLGTFLDKKG